MLKSGLIVGAVAFVLAIVGSLISSLACAPCLGLIGGLGAGYLGGVFDKPKTTGASAKTGAGAGAIGGVGGLLGQVVGGVLNAFIVGPQANAAFSQALGLPVPQNQLAGYYGGAVAISCFLGIVVIVLMAVLGIAGALIWFQVAGKQAAATA